MAKSEFVTGSGHHADEYLRRWSDRLGRLAGASVPDLMGGSEDMIDRFSDEQGARRAIDPAVLGRVFGRPVGTSPERATPDLLWWWALAGDSPVPRPEATGPITPRRVDQAIELWTEIELACLHAAWSLAIDRRDEGLIARCLEAGAWHVAELEPDNATGHAWCVHGFLLLSHIRRSPEADLHAQTLLHGCMRSTGRPDRFSALLLLDAARSIGAWGGD